jgi:predicted acyl esterase/predicted small secreted protein
MKIQPRLTRLLLIALLLLAAALLSACPEGEGTGFDIRGKVISKDGKALARIEVGAVLASEVNGKPDDTAVRPAYRTITDNLGAFRIVVATGSRSTLYYVFTFDPVYRNQASGGMVLARQFPTRKELSSASAVTTGSSKLVEFKLENALSVQDKVGIPMRDGVELAATVVLPEKKGKYPALLVRTPYGRRDSWDYASLAREDYAVVLQDVRGRHDSGGEDMAFVDDAWGKLQDGYDTIEWIARQDWCDGNVGTIGASAMGIAQNLAAGAAPPHLKAQVIIAAAASLYHDAAYVNGVLRAEQVENWLDPNDWDERNLAAVREHPLYDSYWRALNLDERPEVKFPPAIYIGGWYDTFAEGTLRGYHLRAKKIPQDKLADTYLVMGPWSHATMFSNATGDIQLPASAARDFVPDVLAFFNHYLKGAKNAFGEGYPKVQYYVLGSLAKDEEGAPGNFWMTAPSFPPKAADGALFLAPNGELLGAQPDTRVHTVALKFDPASPVRTKGGRNLSISAGPADQRELEDPDKGVISFTTVTLGKPMAIVGPVSVQLNMASTEIDADISVRLCDVYPDGTSFLLLDSNARMSLLSPFTASRKIAPNKLYNVQVDLGDIAYIFNTGHCLRIDLAASNYPRFGLNPALLRKPANIAISVGSDNPSVLHLPVAEELLKNAR